MLLRTTQDYIYDTDGFCDKNKDKLHQDVLDLLKVAGLPLIKEIFSENFSHQQFRQGEVVAIDVPLRLHQVHAVEANILP